MERRSFLLLAGFSLALLKKPIGAAAADSYSTNFPTTENPISEGGRWVNGGATGLDWRDIQTANGFAQQVGPEGTYNDATAVLKGLFPADQFAQATIYRPQVDPNYQQEFELRLRTTITAHSITGYEILFAAGLQIVRWNGPLGNFDYLTVNGNPNFGVAHGDVVGAQMVGNTITVFRNGVQVATATDSVFTSGAPGVGFAGTNPSPTPSVLFGFSSFTSSDSSLGTNPVPSAPAGLVTR